MQKDEPMYALKEFTYDYYEWELVVACSKDIELLQEHYERFHKNSYELVEDEEKHTEFRGSDTPHFYIEKVDYLERKIPCQRS